MAAMNGRLTLDEIGIACGTDKSSLSHDYLVHYEQLLWRLRNEPFNLIEIGIYNGASLKSWATYFERATIVGIDISPACLQYADDRIKIEIGSQDDPEFLRRVVGKYPAKVIIDDGSHRADHQIFSFETLFPLMEEGGCYIVEDLGEPLGSQARIYKGTSSIWAAEYFSELQKRIMFGRVEPEKYTGITKYLFDNVYNIEVVKTAVAVWKKKTVDYSSNLERLEELARRSGRPESFLYLSEYLERKVGVLDLALKAAQAAAELDPRNPWAQFRISQIYEMLGDLTRAADAAQRSVALANDPTLFVERLRRLEKLLAQAT